MFILCEPDKKNTLNDSFSCEMNSAVDFYDTLCLNQDIR